MSAVVGEMAIFRQLHPDCPALVCGFEPNMKVTFYFDELAFVWIRHEDPPPVIFRQGSDDRNGPMLDSRGCGEHRVQPELRFKWL